jgi:hypothetical protein
MKRKATEKFGVTCIRNKLLCELLRRPLTESEVLGFHEIIKQRLIDKKVLIVLDDVDDTEQLEDLCRYHDELGPDSRLIRSVILYEVRSVNIVRSMDIVGKQ